MPIYEYVCTNCGTKTDILHGINDPAPGFCPACGAEGTLRKQFAPPAIHYKGSGWAKKDRGSSSGTKASRASGDATRDAGSSTGDGGSTKGSGSSSGDAGSSGSSGSTSSGSSGSSGSSSADD